MRSSSGQHFVALDHLRALAAFLVFAWHFLHSTNGVPVPFEGAPSIFPFAIFDEGHTGVALFMVLSGYLFAKLLEGKEIYYGAFFWNRFIRLAVASHVIIFPSGAGHCSTQGT
jgi:peptidoglycan/LPS O-acetylase OafA/YrhL